MAETIRVVMVNHAAQDINVSPDDLWCAIVEDYVAAGKFRTEGTVEALDDPSALYGGYRLCLNRESIVDERIVRITERDEAARRLSAVADYLSVPGGMRVFATYHAQERLNGARFSIDCHAELGIATPPDRLEAKLNGMRIEAHAQLASYLASVRSRLEMQAETTTPPRLKDAGDLMNMEGKPVRKTIGGVSFEDRFAHLHEDTPEVLAWQWDQDQQAREAAQSAPGFSAIRDRLLQLADAGGQAAPRKRGAYWFGFAAEGDDQIVRASVEPKGHGRTVISRSALAQASGGTVLMSYYEPSPQGRFVAVGWGTNGDMLGQWSVYETATGAHLLDTPAILYSGARPAWLADESGFWLNARTPDGTHQLRFVPVLDGAGTPEPILLPETLVASKHSGLTLQISPDSHRAVAVTEPHEHIALVHIDLATLEATAFMPEGFEGECDGGWLDNDTYVARVTGGTSHGRVVAIPVATSRDMGSWREIVPESEGYIGWAGIVAGRLYVGDLVDVSLRVRVFEANGALLATLPLDRPGSSQSMAIDRAIRPTDILAFTHTTFARSSVLLIHAPLTSELRQVGDAKHRLDSVVADQRFAISADGTRIPYFVVRRNDIDESAPRPTLVNAYGGFNLSLLPAFPTTYVPLIEAGGVFVQASLRGGAEYGKAWHDGGRLFNKQNTFDDLRAVAQALIADGVTAPDRLAFMGGSNGGLLAGVAIVQQPELWRAVVPTVPIFDLMEPLPDTPAVAGVRAIFLEDYGNPEEADHAASIFGWSPYHNVADGIAYPAVFQVFGEKDVGCMPFHGRKFTARLLEANGGDRPVHLRVWRNTGHGAHGAAAVASWNAEWLAFVMDQIGLKVAGAQESHTKEQCHLEGTQA